LANTQKHPVSASADYQVSSLSAGVLELEHHPVGGGGRAARFPWVDQSKSILSNSLPIASERMQQTATPLPSREAGQAVSSNLRFSARTRTRSERLGLSADAGHEARRQTITNSAADNEFSLRKPSEVDLESAPRLQLDARRPDYLGPFVSVFENVFAEFVRRTRKYCIAEFGDPPFQTPT
jgi:hypothetical protein